MKCSIGEITSESCENSSYSFISEMKPISDFSLIEKEILSIRIPGELHTICTYHKKKYLHKYHHLFGQTCCDPFSVHKKIVKKSLREITLELSKNLLGKLTVTPGKSLCSACYMKIQPRNNEIFECENLVIDEDPEYEPSSSALSNLNKVCDVIGVSPLKIQKLRKEKRIGAAKKKFLEIQQNIKRKFETSLDIDAISSDTDSNNEENFNFELIEKLKEKMKVVRSVSDKVKILSLVPTAWSIKHTSDEFGVSKYLVRQTWKLVSKCGIMPDLEKRKPGSGKSLSDSDLKEVYQFYNSDEVSRMCPGMKDYVTTRNKNGEKEHIQKRLILCNLKALYSKFCETFPDLKVSFSKFAEYKTKMVYIGWSSRNTFSMCMHEASKCKTND